ncbi:hypothetical protein GF337_03955 [candidate division KSB1 bacterium]|nr:hypothetical protein [candidate division KSB1 bacterium]
MSRSKLHSVLERIAQIQTIILIGILYVILGGIVFLMMKLFRSNPLDIRLEKGSYWSECKQKPAELDLYLNQF